MFRGFYTTGRFKFIHKYLTEQGFVGHVGAATISKMGCFYGTNLNWYIDASDGTNEDVGVEESSARIVTVISECKGKPFVMFKTSYSPVWCKTMTKLARENNGDVLPFYFMSYYPETYDIVMHNKKKLSNQFANTEKEYDVGFCAGLKPYYRSAPDEKDPIYNWKDKAKYGLGSGEDTGQLIIPSRQNLYDKLMNSRFKFFHSDKLSMTEYIQAMMKCKVMVNPPGCGEYTPRTLESAYFKQAVVVRKSSYDNVESYKDAFNEIDFNAKDWEDKLQVVVDNYEEHGIKANEYVERVYNPVKLVNHIKGIVKPIDTRIFNT